MFYILLIVNKSKEKGQSSHYMYPTKKYCLCPKADIFIHICPIPLCHGCPGCIKKKKKKHINPLLEIVPRQMLSLLPLFFFSDSC